KIVSYKPPGASTGYSQVGCYMNWTRNCCSPATSGEHFISETVLSILNPKALRIGGMRWIPAGETRDLPLTAARAPPSHMKKIRARRDEFGLTKVRSTQAHSGL